MKTIYQKTTLLFTTVLIAALFLTTNNAKACTDYHPPAIGVTCEYDATFTEAVIRVWGLQLFGSPAGPFCTCAISNYTNIFTNVNYVAFVDSGTTNVVAGFAPWTASANGATAWNNIQTGNWDAFLAESVGPGLTMGAPVELIIRATLPPGYYYNILDSNLVATTFGTDEYDIIGDSLALTHNSISSFFNALGGINYVVQPLSYFTNLDNIILNVLSNNNSIEISIYPNPTQNQINIETNNSVEIINQVKIFDISGKLIYDEKFRPTINISHLSKGLHFLKLELEGGKELHYKLLKN